MMCDSSKTRQRMAEMIDAFLVGVMWSLGAAFAVIFIIVMAVAFRSHQ